MTLLHPCQLSIMIRWEINSCSNSDNVTFSVQISDHLQIMRENSLLKERTFIYKCVCIEEKVGGWVHITQVCLTSLQYTQSALFCYISLTVSQSAYFLKYYALLFYTVTEAEPSCLTVSPAGRGTNRRWWCSGTEYPPRTFPLR